MTILKKLSLWNWRVVSTTTVIGLGLIAVYWKALPPEVPLLYSRPWGQDQLVSPYFLMYSFGINLFGICMPQKAFCSILLGA